MTPSTQRITVSLPTTIADFAREDSGENLSAYVATAVREYVLYSSFARIGSWQQGSRDNNRSKPGVELTEHIQVTIPLPVWLSRKQEGAPSDPVSVSPGQIWEITEPAPTDRNITFFQKRRVIILGSHQSLAADPYRAPCVPFAYPGQLPTTPITPEITGDLAGQAAAHLVSSIYTPNLAYERKQSKSRCVGLMNRDGMERVSAAISLVLGLDGSVPYRPGSEDGDGREQQVEEIPYDDDDEQDV